MRSELMEIMKQNGVVVSDENEKIKIESLALVSMIVDLESKFNVELMEDNGSFLTKMLAGEGSVDFIESQIQSLLDQNTN